MDDRLLIRFLTHNCSAEDLRQIDEWIAADEANGEWLFQMEQIWSLKDELRFSDEQEINRAFNRFISGNNVDTVPKTIIRILLKWTKYAAAVAIIILLSVNLHVLLTEETEAGMNLVEVPKAEQVTLTLSDGTKVWLNADTKFSYPSRFGDKREVTIDGEGYFDVSENKDKPFIVKGDLFNITVLGTEFNVRSYKDEDTDISLKKGRISVNTSDVNDQFTFDFTDESRLVRDKNNQFVIAENREKILLKPNDHLHISTNGKVSLQQMDMSNIDSWRKGEIAFVAQPLSVIVKTLERKYDVHIVLSDRSLENELFNCRTRNGTSLVEVLDLLRTTNKIDYTINDYRILITKK